MAIYQYFKKYIFSFNHTINLYGIIFNNNYIKNFHNIRVIVRNSIYLLFIFFLLIS